MKTLLIGYGNVARTVHAPVLKESRFGLTLSAVCDTDESALKEAHEIYNVPVFLDIDNALNQCGYSCAVVSVPPLFQSEVVRKCLEANLDVLCEKPVSITSKDAYELRKFARQNKCLLMPCYQYIFSPTLVEIKNICSHPDFGKIKEIKFSIERLQARSNNSGVFIDWRTNKREEGGGIHIDYGTHTLYLAEYFLGYLPNQIQYCKFENTRWKEYKCEDTVNFCLKKGEVSLYVTATWAAFKRRISITLQSFNGSECVFDENRLYYKYGDTETQIKKVPSLSDTSDHIDWYRPFYDNFFKATSGNKTETISDFSNIVEMIERLINHAEDG
jgi:predicted dehydrogenase